MKHFIHFTEKNFATHREIIALSKLFFQDYDIAEGSTLITRSQINESHSDESTLNKFFDNLSENLEHFILFNSISHRQNMFNMDIHTLKAMSLKEKRELKLEEAQKIYLEGLVRSHAHTHKVTQTIAALLQKHKERLAIKNSNQFTTINFYFHLLMHILSFNSILLVNSRSLEEEDNLKQIQNWLKSMQSDGNSIDHNLRSLYDKFISKFDTYLQENKISLKRSFRSLGNVTVCTEGSEVDTVDIAVDTRAEDIEVKPATIAVKKLTEQVCEQSAQQKPNGLPPVSPVIQFSIPTPQPTSKKPFDWMEFLTVSFDAVRVAPPQNKKSRRRKSNN